MPDSIPDRPYDIVIVGTGPAGSSAARSATLGGARVLMIDRRQRIGTPVYCAEFISRWAFRHGGFSSQSILNAIETMAIHLPGKEPVETKSPGYMLDRSLFDKELALSAVSSGAQIATGTEAIGLAPEGLIVKRGTERKTIRARVIIGADGVYSSVARWAGLSPVKRISALQYEVAFPRSSSRLDIFFHSDYEGGYAWFFPKRNTVNVGLGVIPSKSALLPNLLHRFLNHLVDMKILLDIHIVGKTGGAIPCEKQRKTVFGNILLAGDAAGHTHPITGAGILNAMIAGEIAGRTAAQAIKRGDLSMLENYETEWHEAFGNSLIYGALKRQWMEENWNRPGIKFETLIRKIWVGFKEYYEDRKKTQEQSI